MSATLHGSVAINGNTPQIFTGGDRLSGSASGTGNPVMGDYLPAVALVSFQAAATATKDVSYALPYGARILNIAAYQLVAPTGATSTLSVGTTAGAADIAAAQDVETTIQTTVPLALNAIQKLTVANFASIVATSAGGSVIWVRNAQGTPTAVGSFTLAITYTMQ